jgi:hypothetical protein
MSITRKRSGIDYLREREREIQNLNMPVRLLTEYHYPSESPFFLLFAQLF